MHLQLQLPGLLGDEDPLAQELRNITFVIVDLETTGGAPDGGGITEVGAVKVRGGEQLGQLATLVNPGVPIPPFITVLTGITTAMVSPAPTIERVLPSLLEFLSGAVLVAHNAPYDVGFLKAACAAHGYKWPAPRVLDTALMARRVLLRDEVPNRKLGTLAAYFRTHTPTHRALDDALATVDVLHALIGRLGSLRVTTLGETISYLKPVTPTQRSKRFLAEGLPHAPGVYIFRAADDRPLYVGTSGDIATRVRSYFTAGEKRARISEMLAASTRVDAVVCAHSLEAQVRELRLIAAHSPPYNRRSKHPERVHWIKLTAEAFPRLSLVRRLGPEPGAILGPFSGRRTAQAAIDAVHEAIPLRQCSQRLSARRASSACALAELGRCPAPCLLHINPEQYQAELVDRVQQAFHADPDPVVQPLLRRMAKLAQTQRFEEAAQVRDRMLAFLRTASRMQRLASLTSIAELVAAKRTKEGGWEIAIVRHGRLAGAATAAPGIHPRRTLDILWPTAETVILPVTGHNPTPCATAEESERIIDWLELPETRLVEASAGWASPMRGAMRLRSLLTSADSKHSDRQ
ncbi:DNA polymerase III subunit epsilon [Rhizocola hellebori]|uniref:DNA polymerase III subunit epsilon n=1 Tax=Rhizocola hellebori TaxID=1392758 RepID=A0A8J3VJL4_9ACTN|nr:DNA polymerase III subunit epsilon [Rhizocola hellebori]